MAIASMVAFSIRLLTGAQAAEWPANWLGQPDNEYIVLHVPVYFYGAVLHDQPGEDGIAPLPAELGGRAMRPEDWVAELAKLPEASPAAMQAEFERAKADLIENSRFYWRNSRFNVAFEFEWHSDYTPRLHSSIAGMDAPYFSPVDYPVYGDARLSADGLVQTYTLFRYSKDSGALERVRGGGGFTWGSSDTERKCGWSWWAAPPADNACFSDWLFCHEFGHQLDSLFHESGHPEHWFNHLAMLEGNTARFGEHFDCMSYILRRTKEADWLDLRWGQRRSFRDADGDHAPDPDDWLSARGLECDPDPTRADADEDGLGDYAELLCGNGNRLGHGEMLHPAVRYCDPLASDTDGDGLHDAVDEFPYVPLIGHVQPVEGQNAWLEDKSLAKPVTVTPAYVSLPAKDGAPAMSLVLAYNPDKELKLLLFWGSAGDTTPGEARITFDFDNDGWFAGDDNYRLTIGPEGISRAARQLCYSHTDWPHDDALDIAGIPCRPLADRAGYACAFELTLTHEQFPELAAKAGEELGLNFGVKYAGQPRYAMLFDPNALLPLELR